MILNKAIIPSFPIVSATISVTEGIAIMNRDRVNCLLVVEQQLVGSFSEREVIALIASGKAWEKMAISEVMNRNLITISSQEASDLSVLWRVFQENDLQNLPILDEKQQIIGIVTRSRLLEVLSEQTQQQIGELTQTNIKFLERLNTHQELEEELRTNELALRLSQERMDSILSSLEDVVWSLDAQNLQLLYLNTAVEKVYGRKIAEFIENISLWREVIHPEDRDKVEAVFQALYSTGRQELEYRIFLPNEEIRRLRVRARLIIDVDGNHTRIDGITTDVTERYRIQEQLQYDAFHDGLTGLANRNLLKDRLEQAIRRSHRRDDNLFALLCLDLDRFKVINDSLGHIFGDRLLVSVAHRLEKCQRVGDTVARLGGDEFVILLEDLAEPEDAIRIAERIQAALKPAIAIDESEIFITASIGIVFGNAQTYTDPEQITDLLRDADIAMYRAKARHQADYEVFDPSMHTYAVKRLQLENDLRKAIANLNLQQGQVTEFDLHYQPIFSLLNQQIEGFEALIRWQHPERGIISPVDFIAIAEETGLIVDLDRWVLKTACYQLRTWQEQFSVLPPLNISVNLSGKHFYQSGLVEFLDTVLIETGLDGKNLKLEITESIVIENTEAAAIMLDSLRKRQIQVCLDDFGTGYSSLSYLHSFPFNVLKIDRSFVKQLGIEEENDEIVKAIINLGLILGLNVVAEGVETPEQVSHLKKLNCHYGQGYWFSKPMNGIAMTEFLLNSASTNMSQCFG